MGKVLVIGGGGSGASAGSLVSAMHKAVLSVPCEAVVEPYTGSDPRIEWVCLDIDLKIDRAELIGLEFEEIPAQVPDWSKGFGITGTMTMEPEDAEAFEAVVRQIRVDELLRDVRRMGKVILVGMNWAGMPRSLSFHHERLDMMTARDEKALARSKGRVHTSGRSRAARADRWR